MQPRLLPGPLILGPVLETGRPLSDHLGLRRLAIIFWPLAQAQTLAAGWGFDELMTRAGARFSRVEPRRRARAFVLGLLAGLPRKNCRTIAGHAGDRTPDGMQHPLSRARRDAGRVRDDVRSYVVEQPGDPGAVLVADETGDVEKGTAAPGVQRQYAGTAGRIENARAAVCLGYAAPHGHALTDRELYLPKSWTGDPARCEAAGIPGHTAFATKPQAGQPDDRAGRQRAGAVRLGGRRRGLRG